MCSITRKKSLDEVEEEEEENKEDIEREKEEVSNYVGR
jgi:hypothetical protein